MIWTSVVPGGRDLADFFFQRHARKQVGDAVVDREMRVACIWECRLVAELRGFFLGGEGWVDLLCAANEME